MATRTQGFNAVPAGATPAAGNTTDSGDTYVSTTLTPGTGTVTIVGTTTAGEVIDGVASVKGTFTGNAVGSVSQPRPTTATTGALATKRRWAAAPTVNCSVQVIRNTGGRSASVSLLSTGQLKVSTASADLYTTPSSLTFPGIYFVSLAVDTGTTAGTDGRVSFAVYDTSGSLAGGMSAVQAFTGQSNVGAGSALNTDQAGKTDGNTLTAAWVDIQDSWQSTDAYTLIAPPSTNTPPTITGGGTLNTTTGATASLTASATDTGSVASFSCTLTSTSGVSNPTIGTGVVTGAGTTSASVAFPITGLVNGKHVFSVTATDNLGTVSTPVTWTVNATSGTPSYRSATSSTDTVVGGGTLLQAFQAATPSARYALSPAPPGGASGSLAFQPLTASSQPIVFGITGRATDSATSITRTVYLKENGTIRATRTGALTTTDSTVGGTTTTSETSSISDRSAMTVDWSDT